MNETFGDLMSEYEKAKTSAKCFSAWDNMDQFVEALVRRVANANKRETYKISDFGAPVITPTEPMRQFQEYSFDGNGAPIPPEDTNG